MLLLHYTILYYYTVRIMLIVPYFCIIEKYITYLITYHYACIHRRKGNNFPCKPMPTCYTPNGIP